MKDTATQRAFVLRMGEGRLAVGKKHGLIGIGWGRVKNLPEIKDWGAFKRAIGQAYDETNPWVLGNTSGSVWRFIHEMNPEDLVLVPDGPKVHICKVEGHPEYSDEYHEQYDLGWYRKAQWEAEVHRADLGTRLWRRLKARQTCVRATDLLDEVEKIRKGEKRGFLNDAKKGAHEAIREALHKSINDYGLERLVQSLLRKEGFDVKVLPRNQQKSGDIDVLAVYSFRFGEIRLGFQVKQHEGRTDKEAVEQVEEALGKEIDAGFVVTTAKSFSAEAEKKAGRLGIVLITEDDLVDWILDSGLGDVSV